MVNKVILIGNLGADPEIRTLETGVKVARLRIATTERFTNQMGERKEHTEWHTIVLWRSQADFVEKFLHKGNQVFVEGKIRTREKVDENGGKRIIYEIHAEEIRILGRRENGNSNSEQNQNGEQAGVLSSTFGGTYSNNPAVESESKDVFVGGDNLPF